MFLLGRLAILKKKQTFENEIKSKGTKLQLIVVVVTRIIIHLTM